ncbi:hypothetical protein EJB05_39064, partial [Eragrostis curvula]
KIIPAIHLQSSASFLMTNFISICIVVVVICTMGRTILVSGFDLTDSADHVKDLLERIAGIGTIFALKLRPPKKVTTTSKAFAVVQFDTEKSASLVESAAQRNVLRNGRFYLKVRPADRDIVPRPKTTMFSLEDTVLHFGCLVKENVLHVLWSAKEVSVKFGFDMKKIQFYLIYNFIKYKLELSYESIWDMKLHRPPAHRSRTKFLLIQVQAVPKIYEALPSLSGLMYDDPIYNYFRDDTDDQWTRTIDFTPSASIGQSTMLCLEVPQQCDLPNIGDYFFYYKEFNDDFECHKRYSYSCGTRIVPVVKSPNDIDVPYEILFKINNMVQIGTLSGPTLDADFFRLVSPKFIPMDHINHALSEMSELKSTCLNPTNWLSLHYSNSLNLCSSFSKSSQISLDDGLVYVYRVQVTPAKVYFYEPEINVSNRVVRKYLADIDNFLRVSFVDEDCEKLRSVDLSPRSVSGNNSRRTALYYRVLSVLSDGITIGDKHFEFLAFSSSQLRDNSTWMFASREGLTASDIRKWMGDFRKIRNVAKYAARLGQSFSSSTETLKVQEYEVEKIPDITNGTRYIFSDGIGKISADFAMEVAMKCKVKRFTPSAFQIRYGGYKGVVAVDPRSNRKLSLRESMSKFNSQNVTLDVLIYSKYQPCFLNRQLITLLSTLGVGDSVFESKTSKLLELKTKSKIFIPSGRAMMGCLDETRTLKYGQADVIFICLVRPLLSKLFSNLVVCACRSHPNECSGSDLDGDIYFVSWDQSLIPTRMVAPMDYSPAPTETLDHEVMIECTCIELAKLFSVAVDFPKTGVPAVIPHELHVKEYPDFMEKLDKPTYVSKEAMECKEFDYKLGHLMDHYGIKSEAEITSGCILKMSKIFTKSSDADAIKMAVRSLRKEARSWFSEMSADGHDAGDAMASAWYHVTYHPDYWGRCNGGTDRPHLISFPWCVYDRLLSIKQRRRT